MTNRIRLQQISRRRFLQTTAALAATRGFPVFAQQQTVPDTILAYIGSSTGAPGAEDNGKGIELFEMNFDNGGLTRRSLAAKTANPSWIVLHPSKKFLYAVNEVSNFHGGNGSVSAFSIDSVSGELFLLNAINSEGAGPAYVSVDGAGRYVFVANYTDGSIAVLPVDADGALGAAVDVHRDRSFVGAQRAANAPRGSFAVSGHDAPHAHMIAVDPQNRFVLTTDLGQDRIYTYRFDRATGKLTLPGDAPFVSLPSGDGPRHFAFHPNGRWLYSIQEEASTVVFFHYDSADGSLRAQQTVSALPRGFAGTSFASEIIISPDGKNLYAANRLHDTIAIFSIGVEGWLKHLGEVSTMGDYPRQCAIAPGGNFLYVCNQHSDAVTCFRIERGTGALTFTGQYTPVASPACITFLD